MKRRPRIRYTDSQKAVMWDRWQKGDSMHEIARLFDRSHSSIQRILTDNGGIRPRQRKRSPLALTLAEREIISRGLATQLSMREIASQIGRSPSTVSREVKRNGGYASYRASSAENAAWQRTLRPKVCRLAGQPHLVRLITEKLQEQWSPDQIAGWLKRQYPDNECYHVSHETIYKSLFIQARGVLKKELLACLRSQRIARRPRPLGRRSHSWHLWQPHCDIGGATHSVRDVGQSRKQEDRYGNTGTHRSIPKVTR